MKTKANQSAAERNITMVALADIQPSGFNPRKRFDETSLYELAESIKQHDKKFHSGKYLSNMKKQTNEPE